MTETESGALVARLHAGLANCPDDLDLLVPLDSSVPDGLRQLTGSRSGYVTGDDVERALAEWAALEPWATDPAAHARAFPDVPVQPVHGDAPFYNLIETPEGLLSSDFEHVGLGPAKWDLVGAPAGVRAGYDATARELGLRELDERLLQLCERGRTLQVLAVMPLADQVPAMAAALEPVIADRRAEPPITDRRAP